MEISADVPDCALLWNDKNERWALQNSFCLSFVIWMPDVVTADNFHQCHAVGSTCVVNRCFPAVVECEMGGVDVEVFTDIGMLSCIYYG